MVMFILSCSDSTPVGSGILEDDEIKVQYSEDFTITAKTVLNQPSITFTGLNNAIVNHYTGSIRDDVFGGVEASFYFQMLYFNTATPTFTDTRFDSLVIMLELSPGLTYGDSLAKFDIEIYRLLEDISTLDTIRSNVAISREDTPVGVIRGFQPGKRDTIKVFDPISRREVSLFDVVRVPMSREFALELFNATDVSGSNANLVNRFNGFYLKAVTTNNSMMAFDLTQAASNNLMFMYYSRIANGDTTSTRFDYFLGSTTPLNYVHDYTESEIFGKFERNVEGDDVMYVQGLSGSDVELDLTDLLKLKDQNALINHVVLELTLANDRLTDSRFPTSPSLGLYKKSSSGNMRSIKDLEIGRFSGSRSILFNGNLETDPTTDISTYKMNITAHVKDMLKGLESSKVYLSVLDKADNPTRAILYGPQHSIYPIKVKITYTTP
jgi:hypothetical protein